MSLKNICLTIFILLQLVLRNSDADAIRVQGSSHGQKPVVSQTTGKNTNVLITREGEIIDRPTDPAEVLELIVEFKEAPLWVQAGAPARETLTAADYQRRFDTFGNDLRQIEQKQAARANAAISITVKRQFYKLFFGVVITIPRSALGSITHLPYVKKVHRNERVQAYLDESVPLIKADQVWQNYGTTGQGVIVGILDTGVDYTHPALGGGFGPDHKVMGGYDFANNDADPFDDHGHGTHVAGIVAADDDSLRGVAPDVRLMAFKVLDQDGYGWEDDIISGIERAGDPNNNGDPSDHVDILSISLGGYGNPDDPMSQAIDHINTLGVTACIAAGNDGDYLTIGSPGTARTAITVGASDKHDKMAWFSSKGPALMTYAIKPEIIAPGVNINSLAPAHTYARHSGTSMAAPHVTGVAALLKAIHPEWSPADIKSAIVTTALDLGHDVMTQGAGRIDALAAARAEVSVQPALLSFGLDAADQAIWSVTDTLRVFNHAAVTQTFSMTADGLQPGIALTVSPAHFTLAAGAAQQLIISLAVTNALVSYPTEFPMTYEGRLHLTGTQNILSIPWAFVKASKVTLTFDEPYADFSLFSENAYASDGDWIDMYTADVVVPKGRYILAADFHSFEPGIASKFVFRENVDIEGYANLAVSAQEAVHKIELKGVDNAGLPFSESRRDIDYIWVYPPGYRLLAGASITSNISGAYSLLTSPFSDRIKLLTGEFVTNTVAKTIESLQYDALQGVHGDHTLTNSPAAYRKLTTVIHYPPTEANKFLAFANTLKFEFAPGQFFAIGLYDSRDRMLVQSPPAAATVYATADAHSGFGFTAWGLAELAQEARDYNQTWLFTPLYTVAGDKIGCFDFPTPDVDLYADGGEIVFGLEPIHGEGYFLNNLPNAPNFDIWGFGSYGPQKEWRLDLLNAEYRLFDRHNALVETDTLYDFEAHNLPAAPYRFELNYANHWVAGQRGAANYTANFDLQRTDANPPVLTALKLRDAENQPASHLTAGKKGTLVLATADFFYTYEDLSGLDQHYQSVRTDSTRVWFKASGASVWQEVPVQAAQEDSFIGRLYQADLSPTTVKDSTRIDLKIRMVDASGNSAEWRLNSAYVVGDGALGIETPEDDHPAIIPAAKARLLGNYPNPFRETTAIRYELPAPAAVKLRIYNLAGQLVKTLADEHMPAGLTTNLWDGKNEAGQPAGSGVYLYRLEANGNAVEKRLILLH